ncbi:MAG: sugar transferase [Gemmatimonadaceae bacterium]
MKRTCDLVAASVGLVLLSPLLLAIAVLVWLDAGRPILYRGVRTGLQGRPFQILKFRTMVVDAEQRGGGSTAKDDPRVTRLGRLLRHHKLDELPQLINVVRGDMSIVGPRPELPQYTALYTDEERAILSVRPGITDIASLEFIRLSDVLGNDDPDLVYETRVRPIKNALRVEYVRTHSLGGDFRLVVRTLAKLFAR